MAAFDPATLDRWRALAIVDRDGTTVGTVREFYLDRETGHPTWALVESGLFGATQVFVPLLEATEISDGLQVPYEKRHIKDAPIIDPHDELTPDEEAVLFAHYGIEYQPAPVQESAGSGTVEPGPVASEPAAGPGGSADPGSGAQESGPARSVEQAPGGPEGAAEPGSVETRSGPADRPAPDAPGPVRAEAGGRDQGGSGSAEAADQLVAGREPQRPEAVGTGTVASSGTVAPATPGSEASGPVPPEPGTAGSAGDDRPVSAQVDAAPGSAGPEPPRTFPASPASTADQSTGSVPAEPGIVEPSEAVRTDTTHAGSSSEWRDQDPDSAEADLSRPAAVEPGLPGSTSSNPAGPTPTTVRTGQVHGTDQPPEEAQRPDEAGWAPDAPAPFVEDDRPADRPTSSTDRWREAKLAAERDRIAREAAPPEERSPLERARRRLERLVGGGQAAPEPDTLSPTDRDAAERARRARLGLDEDDHPNR